MPLAAVVGSATHVLWDSFTHAIVIAAAAKHLSALPVVRDQRQPRALSPRTLPASAAAATLVGLVVAPVRIPDGPHTMAFDGVVSSILTGLALTVMVAMMWRLKMGRTRV